MKPASDYADLGGGLACWEAYDPANKVDLYGSAVRVGRRLFFIDPIPLEADALDTLTEDAVPAGIVLTNANHARAAALFRRQFELPVWMSEGASAEVGLTADELIPAGGGSVFDGVLEALPLPGAAAGEIALYRAARASEDGGGVMIVGDALVHLPAQGFSILPDKYCQDAKTLRRSLEGLLDWEFETLLFAHGEPILRGARERLAALLGV